MYTFQSEVLKILKRELPGVRKIHYFSDRASSQYKNKNFLNICCHENTFNLSPEWNFFAISHGKSACDDVGGTVKRLALRASLQRPYQGQIPMTPRDLFTWAESNVKGIVVHWVPDAVIQGKQAQLAPRFERAVPLRGSWTFHHFKPASLSTVRAGLTSYSATEEFRFRAYIGTVCFVLASSISRVPL